jgi:hypothetical protein
LRRFLIFCLSSIALVFAVVVSAESYRFENRWYVESAEISFSFRSGEFTYYNSHYDNYGTKGIDKDIPLTMSGAYSIKDINGFLVADVKFIGSSHRIFVFSEDSNIIIYDTLFKRVFFGTENAKSEAAIFPVHWAKATSYYTEILGGKEIEYSPDNLARGDITKPWVEGIKGNGEGEVLRVGRYAPNGIRHLLILNGFFSPVNPQLYWDNSRVKTLKLKGYDEEGELIYEGVKELEDKPGLQLLTAVIPAVEFEIEIVDVYPGKRFADTAISGVFHDGLRYLEEQRIP